MRLHTDLRSRQCFKSGERGPFIHSRRFAVLCGAAAAFFGRSPATPSDRPCALCRNLGRPGKLFPRSFHGRKSYPERYSVRYPDPGPRLSPQTVLLCSKAINSPPEVTSQTFTVPSLPELAKYSPSGLKAVSETLFFIYRG